MITKKTSQTDRPSYKAICRTAAEYDEVFDIFKQHIDYIPVLEHMNQQHGNGYRNIILKDNVLDKSKFEKFKENDIYGTPTLYDYGTEFGMISPSTLRYVKILSDLKYLFGSLDNFNIVEIGGGYGGQAKIIMDYFNVKEYNFIDLPESLALTKKYLGKFNYPNLKFLDFENLPNKKYDLVISNYALSECSREMQEIYINEVLNNTKHGYMIMNVIRTDNIPQSEWLKELSNVKLYPDLPKTANGNYIMTYTNNKLISGYLWAWTDIDAGTKTVKLFKKFYPESDMFINVDYEGSLDEYTKLGKKVGAVVTRNNFQVGYCGDFGDRKIGRTHWPRENAFEWIRGLYDACKKTDSKYMIILEEDNYLLKPLSILDTDFSMVVHASKPSAAGNYRPNSLPQQFLEYSRKLGGVDTSPGYGAGGGCIFNREEFIKSWDIAKDPLWKDYDDLAKISKIIGWEDFIVQFIMMIGGYKIDQLYCAAQPWEHPNWKTEPNYKGDDYEMVCGLKDHTEIII